MAACFVKVMGTIIKICCGSPEIEDVDLPSLEAITFTAFFPFGFLHFILLPQSRQVFIGLLEVCCLAGD